MYITQKMASGEEEYFFFKFVEEWAFLKECLDSAKWKKLLSLGIWLGPQENGIRPLMKIYFMPTPYGKDYDYRQTVWFFHSVSEWLLLAFKSKQKKQHIAHNYCHSTKH